jgi:hypothetical protein
MKRRLFSVSLLSLLSTLPTFARRVLALPAEKGSAAEGILRWRVSQTQPPPAGTVAILPIGFEGDTFGLTAFAEGGEMLTQTVTVDATPPRSPAITAQIELPLVERGAFPTVEQPFRLVQGTANFDGGVGDVPYSVVAVDPTRAWTAKGVQVAAAGEILTVRTTRGDDGPIIITERFGASPLAVSVSPTLRRLLEQKGVNVDELIQSAKSPNLRQRTLQTRGGQAIFRVPDPPLGAEFAAALGVVQVVIWSPVSFTVQEREG